jgi:membrane protease YdiL (CAAX protease family)
MFSPAAKEIAQRLGLNMGRANLEEFADTLMALAKNAPLGILLSAVMFGTAHAYQGFAKAVNIGVLGAMYGIFAHWRKSVRPGMIAHTLQDVLGGLFAGSIKH